MEKLVVNGDLYLSPPTDNDKDFFVKYLNDEEIHHSVLNLPYPCSERDAEQFLERCREDRKKYGRSLYWLIRRNNGEAIGGIGFQLSYGIDSHKDTIDYWLGQPYRGHGIMSKALKRFCDYGFSYLGLVRIEAVVLDNNPVSTRILLKNSFKYEGLMKKAYCRKGHYIDVYLYASVK